MNTQEIPLLLRNHFEQTPDVIVGKLRLRSHRIEWRISMKYMFISSITLTLVAFISANAQTTNSKPAKADAAELEAMQGVWKPVDAVLGGAPLPQRVLDSITLKISGDKYEVTVEG